jgi:hypothetical protein
MENWQRRRDKSERERERERIKRERESRARYLVECVVYVHGRRVADV